MSEITFEIKGLTEIIQRMSNHPVKLRRLMETGMDASLVILHENVQPYPAPPPFSTYVRTGTLGRSIGASTSGGKSGVPTIYEKRQVGGSYEGIFGTNLKYAPYVIGEGSQASVHIGRWWTQKTIVKKASGKLNKLWDGIVSQMALFLEGKGLL